MPRYAFAMLPIDADKADEDGDAGRLTGGGPKGPITKLEAFKCLLAYDSFEVRRGNFCSRHTHILSPSVDLFA